MFKAILCTLLHWKYHYYTLGPPMYCVNYNCKKCGRKWHKFEH